MHSRKTILYLILIMAIVSLITTGVAVRVLYRAAFAEERARLVETVESQARLIEAVARFDAAHRDQDLPQDARSATLVQVVDAHDRYTGSSETGEFTLAKREGDQMVFLLRRRHGEVDNPAPIPFDSELAEAMRRALSGRSGIVVGLDYRGETVLAAHEPVAEVDWGIVAKIDLAEVRAPFERAGLISAGVGLLVILCGSALFVRVSNPLVRRIRESEERYRAVFERAADSIVIVDGQTGRIEEFNDRARENLGYTPEEFANLTIADFEAGESPDEIAARTRRILERGSETFEAQHRTKQGDVKEVRVSTRALDVPGRKLIASIWHDITDRKRAEEALQEERDFIRSIVDVTGMLVVVLDPEGRIVQFNPACERLTGYRTEEVLGRHVWDFLLTPEETEGVQATFQALRSGDFPDSYENHWVTKDGERRMLAWDSNCIVDAVGNIKYIVGTAVDITERRRAEEALRESESKYRGLFDTMGQGVVYQDADGRITSANPAAERILGLTLDEMLGRVSADPRWRAIHEDGSEYAAETHPSMVALATGNPVRDGLMGVFNPREKAHRWILIDAIPESRAAGERPHRVYATFTDVTERRRAEEALRESEARLRNIVEHSTNVFYSHTPDHVLTYMSPQTRHLLDCEPEEALVTWTELITDNPVNERGFRFTQRAIDTGQRQSPYELELVGKKGRKVWVEVHEAPVVKDHKTIAIVGALTDITDRRRAEEALRDSEQRYRAIVEDQTEFIVRWRPDGTRTFVNEAYCRYFDRSRDDVLGRSFLPLVSAKEREAVKRKIESLTPDSPVVTEEHRVVRPDGTVGWHQWTDRGIFDSTGRLVELQSIGRDVTDRRLAEDALRERETLYNDIVESMSDGILVLDRDFKFLYWNRAMERLSKVPRRELIGSDRLPWEVFPHLAEQGVDDMMRQAMQGRRAERDEIPFRLPDGTEGFTAETYLPLRTADGEIGGIVGVIHDITERKRADEALRESEERYRAAFEQAAVGICHVGLDGRFQRVNRYLGEIWGYTREELIGMSFRDLTRPEDLQRDEDAIARLLAGEIETYSREKLYVRKDRSLVWATLTVSLVRDSSGDPQYYITVVEDISDRRRAEDALRDSEARLRLMFKQMPAVVWTVDGDLRFTSSQGLGLRQLKLDPDQTVGLTLFDYFQTEDEDFPAIVAHRRALNGMSVAFENHWGGRVFQSHVEPLRDAEGRTIGCIGAALDVTEHKAAEAEARRRAEAERLLLRELDHRVRNNLASLIALIDLTEGAADDAAEFGAAIRGRVQAMATVHTLLSRSHWEPVRLQTLLGALIPPGCRGIIRLDGPEVGLAASQAQAMGMVLNELMANSLKHGALSNDRGAVDVSWEISPPDAARRILTLRWDESGGPRIEAEPEPRIGTGLIEGLVAYELRGRAQLAYPTVGARHRFEFPLNEPPGGE